MVSVAMDQTVITSCSKGKLLSDWQGIFYHGGKCVCAKNEAEQTGEVSMKKNQRVGGMCECAGFAATAAACSSATCLNGTQAGARTDGLRLIGHSNVTRSLPTMTRRGHMVKYGRSAELVERGNGAEGLAPPVAKFCFFPFSVPLGMAENRSDTAFGLLLCQSMTEQI